ncbi:MAG: DUF2589 domain-containing protein, partial [Desulfobacterales bacterium]
MQFEGLPFADLIGGPLEAACRAQMQLAKTTADFIRSVSIKLDPSEQTAPLATIEYASSSEGPMEKIEFSLSGFTNTQVHEALAKD